MFLNLHLMLLSRLQSVKNALALSGIGILMKIELNFARLSDRPALFIDCGIIERRSLIVANFRALETLIAASGKFCTAESKMQGS